MSLCEFLFANDAAFVALSNEVLQKILNIADEVLSAFGQSISVTKTEIMVIQPRSEEKPELLPIFVRGQQLQNSLSFKYIGSKISVSASLTAEIDTRLNMMAAAYAKNRIIFSSTAKYLSNLDYVDFSLLFYLQHFMLVKLGMF